MSLLRILLLIFLAGLMVTACNEEAESEEISALKAAMCAGADWPSSSSVVLQNTPVQQQFSKACLSLTPLPDIQFAQAEQAWLCQSFWAVPDMVLDSAHHTAMPDPAAVEAAFADHTARYDILSKARFHGSYFAAIILADAQHQWKQIITHQAELAAQPVTLKTASAAAGWAFLNGTLGEGYAPQSLCKAEITQTNEGWRFNRADIWFNCQPRQWRNFSVSHNGTITIHSTEPQINADGTKSIMCVD